MKQPQQSEAKLHALDYWQVIRNRYGVILLSFFLVFMTAAVVTAIMPKKFLGKVTLEIERLASSKGVFGDDEANARAIASPQFMMTQFKVITSKETLNKVIEKLGLVKRWNLSSRDEAYAKLYEMVDADEERNTDLIKIAVFSTDKNEAAELANEIAQAYANRRNELDQERIQKVIAAMEGSRTKQQEIVDQARAKMMELVEQYKIVDTGLLNRFRGDPVRTGSDEDYFLEKRKAADIEVQIVEYKNQLESIRGKTGDDLISAAFSLQIVDAKTNTLYSPYLQAQTEMKQLRGSGLGARHPDILAIEAKLSESRRLLDEGIKNIRANLEEKLKLAELTLKNAKERVESGRAQTIEEKTQLVTYQQARDNFLLQQEILLKMIEENEGNRLSTILPKTPVVYHEFAVPASTYAKPNTKLQLLLGAVLGLILGIGFAFFLEYLDTSVKTLDDVERYLGVPVLAVIPKDVGILHKQSGLSPDAEAYRILRTNIEFNRKSADANAITIVSGGAGEGKSTTLVNLAFICAQGGYNTLMIDGDLRRPKLHTFFDINNSVGLTNYLTTELMLEDVILQTPIDNLYFMPSGILPADAAGILNSRRMSELIADVKNRFDLVLIDSPPILGVSDASVLASEVDLTIIVIQHRKLPRSMLLRVKQAIENVGGHLLGVVLNNVDVRSDNQYQYYTSYYTYYSPANTAEQKAKPRPKSGGSGSSGGGSAAPQVASSRSAAPTPADGDDQY